MNAKRMAGSIAGWGCVLLLLVTSPVSAQTFSSGSNGSLGAFNPTSTTTVALPADGVLHYTTMNVPSGVTVTFTPNAANTPVTMLATGDVTIAGTISVKGANGANSSSGPAVFSPGGVGGPGGFSGGSGGMRGATPTAGSADQGPGGGVGTGAGSHAVGGSYGTPSTFVALLPLFGGSGGGGVGGTTTLTGPSGGGGGGAIVIASSTQITVTGTISANGGDGGFRIDSSQGNAGEGSGGAIRLVAPQITNSGTIQAVRGATASTNPGTNGRIRLEAFTFGAVAATTPTASISNTPGPVTAASAPALVNLPTLTISSVGGIASPATPGGSYTTADVSLPAGTTNPVPVTLTVTNTPLSTTFTVKLIPQFASPSTATCSNTSGSFSASTCTANTLNFPSGQVSVLNAYASFTLTAALFPLIDGEEVDQIMVAAHYGEPSTLTLITKSGKEVRVDQLTPAEQLLVAKGFEAMLRKR